MIIHYEVQTLLGNDFENCWSEDDLPQKFFTEVEAWQEIQDHINRVKIAVESGHMDTLEDSDNYRVVKIITEVVEHYKPEGLNK